jgi:hypothetical protein
MKERHGPLRSSCKLWYCRSSVLLGYDFSSLGNQILIFFLRNAMLSSLRINSVGTKLRQYVLSKLQDPITQ